MKKIGILLLTTLLWAGVNAQTTVENETIPANETQVTEEGIAESVSNKKKVDEYVTNAIDKALDVRVKNLDDGMPTTGFIGTILILVIALPIIIVFGAIVLIVYFNSKARKERDRLKNEVYLKALETGQPLPEKFFEEPEKAKKSALSGALVMLGLGLGFLLFAIITKHHVMYFAAIVGFIGLGQLIAYLIEQKKGKEKEEKQ